MNGSDMNYSERTERNGPDRAPRRRLARALGLLSVVTLAAGGAMVALAGTASAGNEGNNHNDKKVTLCHWTNGGYYNELTVSVNAVFSAGHDQHQGGRDIIPPFTYAGKHGPKQFDGLNWDDTGQAIYHNGCKVPDAPSSTSLTLVKNIVDEGGTDITASSDMSIWTLEAKSSKSTLTFTGDAIGESQDATPGTYALSENWVDGYANGKKWECVSNQQASYTRYDNRKPKNTVTVSKGESVTCTITNTKLDEGGDEPETGNLTLVKKVMDGNTDITGDADLTRWGLKATGGDQALEFSSGEDKDVTAGVAYALSENTISGYTNGSWSCTLDESEQPPLYFRANAAKPAFATTGDSVTVGADESVTCTVTNTKNPPTSDGDGGGTTITTTTTTAETPAGEEDVEAVTPVVQVLGTSQVVAPKPVSKPVQVKGVSQSVQAAPSANAHTGQGQSPWAYVLFGLSGLLMLGAARARRSSRA